MYVNEIAAYLFLNEQSNDNYEDSTNAPSPEEMLARGQRLIDAMQYVFEHLEGETDEELQKVFYDAGNAFYGKPNLREFFKDIYWVLTGKPDGARIGKLVNIWGIEEFRSRMSLRMSSPLTAF